LREGADKNSNPQAACKRLCVKLPAGTKVRKIYGFAKESEGADYLPCQIDANGIFHSEMHCNIENCAFYPQYQTTVDSVCWTFRNWSLSGSREAKVVVQYEQ
jgi:hypothetical protein